MYKIWAQQRPQRFLHTSEFPIAASKKNSTKYKPTLLQELWILRPLLNLMESGRSMKTMFPHKIYTKVTYTSSVLIYLQHSSFRIFNLFATLSFFYILLLYFCDSVLIIWITFFYLSSPRSLCLFASKSKRRKYI